MTDEVMALCHSLGVDEGQDEVLRPIAQGAVAFLAGRLRRGVTPEDCAGVFPMAAAMLALDSLEGATGEDKVASFTAGQVALRTQSGKTGSRSQRALWLLSPWLGETGFAFRGVDG